MIDIPEKTSTFHETLEEASRYFEGTGQVLLTAERLDAELRSRNIDYVIVGAIALRAHGYSRYTENLDIVLTNDGFQRFKKELLGRGPWGLAGYDSTPEAAKTVCSYPEMAVVKFRIAGEYPGDGKLKPVSFPNPSDASIEIDGVNFATLDKLIELKLASGLTAPDRLKDLADVQELIKIRGLSNDYAERLDPYVRNKFLELVAAVEVGRRNNFEEQL
ncbi:MAG: hypothetical protein DMF72_15030 [Acidobacteria bacterium]|nr:MAG: hypothetical protein DMF72_15030 [Acidobacteriota bacterium]